jgi:hypothetical protein
VLDRLLGMLAEGGVHTPAQLAVQLGVSERLAELMLADLSKMGYLRPISSVTCQELPTGGAGPCTGCPVAGTCAVSGTSGQVWALTNKATR